MWNFPYNVIRCLSKIIKIDPSDHTSITCKSTFFHKVSGQVLELKLSLVYI